MRVAAWHDRLPELATAVAASLTDASQNGHGPQPQHPRVFLLKLVMPP
jgi:hypothetical protein